ncbi:uncharacterized protein LOC125230101 [Leguminivora glycinivorella]|uniref:uncharacterized protein LOC125230101 n=1 Tax=Leguminivora glycinivorella TaxID=1035111 RepID=UPI00200D6E69|nr:uncharacterized protein LOC125230101 [Leguminivora glycinivorella]
MDVMGYTVLQEESLPGFLKGRPQVAMCLACAAALLLITALSITIGIFIGYTYCYIEHKSGVINANITRTNVKIFTPNSFENPDNKTRSINDAIVNNFFVSKLLRVSGFQNEPALSWSEHSEQTEKKLIETTA